MTLKSQWLEHAKVSFLFLSSLSFMGHQRALFPRVTQGPRVTRVLSSGMCGCHRSRNRQRVSFWLFQASVQKGHIGQNNSPDSSQLPRELEKWEADGIFFEHYCFRQGWCQQLILWSFSFWRELSRSFIFASLKQLHIWCISVSVYLFPFGVGAPWGQNITLCFSFYHQCALLPMIAG